MTNKTFIFTAFAMASLVCSTDVLAVGNSVDAGLNTGVGNLTSILNNSLIPIILLCGCLASIAVSFIKQSPTPFIVGLITITSFGFARAWINGTYAVLV
jgi:hypothetical protein